MLRKLPLPINGSWPPPGSNLEFPLLNSEFSVVPRVCLFRQGAVSCRCYHLSGHGVDVVIDNTSIRKPESSGSLSSLPALDLTP